MTAIKLIPIEEIQVEEGYNIRTPAETKANAKQIAATMEATGDNPSDPQFIVQFVVKDGVKYTRNHGTLLAAQNRGWKEILGAKIEHPSHLAERAHLVTSNNGGHPLSRTQQGAIYAELVNGIPKEDAGDGEYQWIHEGVSVKEVAAATGYSAEHIKQCIAIHESSPEIAALLESDQISESIVVMAKNLSKGSDAKQLKILKRCVSYAKEQGADRATKKHFDAIKSEFVELKAAPLPGMPEPEKPTRVDVSNAQESREPLSNANTPPATDPDASDELEKAKQSLLFEQSETSSKRKDAIVALLMEPDNLEGTTIERETCEALADKILALLDQSPL